MSEHFSVQLRLPRRAAEGDVVEVKAKIKHPSRTGLQLVETAATPYERFVRNQPAEYIRQVDIYFDGELINTFYMNSSTSDDPLLSFMLRPEKEAPIRVVVTNHKNEVVEATEDYKYTVE